MNRRSLFIALLLLVAAFSPGCQKSAIDGTGDEKFEIYWSGPEEDQNSPAYIQGVNNTIAKAYLISQIRWKALADVPTTLRGENRWDYPAGGTYKVPYSSVKEKDKFVGTYVSFHTFLSAANNPRSILYKEDVSKSPYDGYNCGAYYGTVCSNSVNFTMGFDAPYSSKGLTLYDKYIKKVKQQKVNSLRPCDMLVASGHSVVITEVTRDETTGDVKSVKYLDVYGIKDATAQQIWDYWQNGPFQLFRYYNLSANADMYFNNESWEELKATQWNKDLSVYRGDKACFREGEDVRINVFSTDYDTIELFKDGNSFLSEKLTTEDHVFNGLEKGMYKARLSKGEEKTDFTFFEILQADVTCEVSKKTGTVSFSSANSKPVAIQIYENSHEGTKLFVKALDEATSSSGSIRIEKPSGYKECLCKVYFRGEYGVVTNEPLLIKW